MVLVTFAVSRLQCQTQIIIFFSNNKLHVFIELATTKENTRHSKIAGTSERILD